MEACADTKWESVELQVRNRLNYEVNTLNYDRFVEWNIITIEINKEIDAICDNLFKDLTKRHGLGKRFQECVSWDLTVSCQEIEFSDVYSPVFFLEQVLPWYRNGHFPCGWKGPQLKPGWEGPMPNGTLCVF